ncbi:ABC transporter permease [Elioraea rosea]|uniref:ABC transporter permease n=1 Tax=Elioraea rosea TaxID=2492390 RepID=UPI001185D133|nr:ABC transporter permease [Elioraea rosea]
MIFRALVIAAYGFLLAPAIFVVAIAFSSDRFLTFPPPGLSLRWFATLFEHEQMMAAMQRSAILAAIVTTLSLAIGVPAAYAIARLRFPGRGAIFAALTAPLLLPTLVVGLGILLVFFPYGLAGTWPGLALAHLAVTLPLVVRIMTTAFATLPPDLEDAAATLGATPLKVAFRITLPLALPGLIAAAALSFLISFDEVVISLFIVGPRLSTLPVEMYRYVEGHTDPMVAALAVVLILLSISVVLLVERLVGFTRTVSK